MQSGEVSLGTKEVRDLTRIERIGAHSHVRGTNQNLNINIVIIYRP